MLNANVIESIVLIFRGNYVSDIYMANDILDEFRRVPEDNHIELIEFVLLSYSMRAPIDDDSGEEEAPQVDDETMSLVLGSAWGLEFQKNVSEAWGVDYCLRELAEVVVSAMNDADDFVQRVAVFVHMGSFLRLPDSNWLTRSKIFQGWAAGVFLSSFDEKV